MNSPRKSMVQRSYLRLSKLKGSTLVRNFPTILMQWIKSRINKFIRHFHITHYVCSISLGAAEYRILSKTEYYNQLSAKGAVGYETISNVILSESFSKKSSTKSFDLRQIGRIVNKEVARGTYDEAVIGIGIQPIHQLVRLRFLHLALRLALLDYFEVQGDRSGECM